MYDDGHVALCRCVFPSFQLTVSKLIPQAFHYHGCLQDAVDRKSGCLARSMLLFRGRVGRGSLLGGENDGGFVDGGVVVAYCNTSFLYA